MDCLDKNTPTVMVVREAGIRALRALNSRYARMLRALELLGSEGRLGEEEIREALRSERLPWRGVGQTLGELVELGYVNRGEDGRYSLTELGGYVYKVLEALQLVSRELVESARKGDFEDSDVMLAIVHMGLHVLLSIMIPVEEQERYHYPGLQAYATLLISNVLSCIYNSPGQPYKHVFEQVLEYMVDKEEDENGGPKGSENSGPN